MRRLRVRHRLQVQVWHHQPPRELPWHRRQEAEVRPASQQEHSAPQEGHRPPRDSPKPGSGSRSADRKRGAGVARGRVHEGNVSRLPAAVRLFGGNEHLPVEHHRLEAHIRLHPLLRRPLRLRVREVDGGGEGARLQAAVHRARFEQVAADSAVHVHGEREGREEGAGGKVLGAAEAGARARGGARGRQGEDRGGHAGAEEVVAGEQGAEEQGVAAGAGPQRVQEGI